MSRSQYTWKNHRFSSGSIFDSNFKDIITEAQKKLPNIKVILLLDEGDHLVSKKVDETAQNNLRAALQELGSNLGCVITGTSVLSTSVVKSSSPLRNILGSLTLNMLSIEETRELITKPASALGYSYSEEAINRIISLSGGQPYCCQALCYEAFDYALLKGRRAIETAALDCAEAKVSKDLFESYFLGLWERTDSQQKKFLSNLANSNLAKGKSIWELLSNLFQKKSSSKSDITQEKINDLIAWNLIKKEQDNYTFCSELIKQWIIRVIKK